MSTRRWIVNILLVGGYFSLLVFLAVGKMSHPKNMTVTREAQVFLRTLYPNTEFHLVCESPRGFTVYGRCSAAAIGGNLPPIAILCPGNDIPQTTCHVASGDAP